MKFSVHILCVYLLLLVALPSVRAMKMLVSENCEQEPGTSFDSRTQKVALWQSTIDSNKRYFADEKDVPRFAYSMGIQSILSSRQIILMAFGKEKAAAVKAALEGPITEDLPASILQTHKHVTVILDEAAAQMLSKK